jgi:hypothetical protein
VALGDSEVCAQYVSSWSLQRAMGASRIGITEISIAACTASALACMLVYLNREWNGETGIDLGNDVLLKVRLMTLSQQWLLLSFIPDTHIMSLQAPPVLLLSLQSILVAKSSYAAWIAVSHRCEDSLTPHTD